jgi:hypothetical protein
MANFTEFFSLLAIEKYFGLEKALEVGKGRQNDLIFCLFQRYIPKLFCLSF